jgi:hypothetical protein
MRRKREVWDLTGYEFANSACDVNETGENIGDEVEESLDETQDGGEEGVNDGVDCVEDRGKELVDGGEKIADSAGDGHFVLLM